MAFGDVMIDRIGPVRATPAASTLTGLLANALGIFRWETRQLDHLQERLVFGCRLDRRGRRFTEFQTAQLKYKERAWMARGYVEERGGGEATYDGPHLRYRDHDADARVTVALRLLDAAEAPTLDDLAHALDEPARPLFLGRKACLPSAPLLAGFVEAATMYDALLAAPVDDAVPNGHPRPRAPRLDASLLVVLPADEPCPADFRPVRACERRDWAAGVHAGDTLTYHGHVPREQLGAAARGAA